MHRSKRYINHTNIVCVVFSLFRPIVATGCDAAAPGVTEASIIAEVCNQTSATGYTTCAIQMTDYMQQSATTCDRYSALSTDCLIAKGDDRTACADPLFGYQDCHNYIMQAYAYCGCYYSLPESLAECANEQLQAQPQDIQTLPQTSTPVTAIKTSSDMPASAASADKEPTPSVPTLSGGAASSSSQYTITISEIQIPNTFTSLQDAIPSSDPKSAWTPDAAPSTTSEPIITIVVTRSTTFTTAAYTTTTALTPASTIISTVYSCANDGSGGGHDAASPPTPTSAASASAPTTLPPIAPASAVGPEPFAPNPTVVVVPASGTEAGEESEATIITTEHISGRPEPSPPSTSLPIQPQNPAPNTTKGTTKITIENPKPSPPSTSTSIPTQAQNPTPNTTKKTTVIPSRSPDPSPPPTSIPATAQNPAPNTAKGTTEIPSRSSAIPSPSQALSTGTGLVSPSETTAGGNASGLCTNCRKRRRSKIFL